MESLKEAEKAALDSLPDETTKIKNIQELQHYVRKGYLAKPLKMPVILMTGKLSNECQYLSNCAPTPPLTQQVVIS